MAAKIVGIYTSLGLLWTALFGGLFDITAARTNELEGLLPYPGVVFMLGSAILLYILIRENNACLLRSQQRLRESHELLHAILENSTSLVIYLKDLRGRYLMVNHQFEILCNRAGSGIIGKSDRELFPKHIAEASIRSDEKAIAIPAPQQFEEVIGDADNERTYLTVKFSLCDRSGKPYAVCGIATDISERKSMEEALRKSEDRFRDITEAASDWIWETDENQRFTHLSHRFYQLTAIPPEQVLGHARWEIADTESDDDK
jgi:PAS domain S-box-containing protein